MSRISEKFSELMARGETALIPYIMAGDPDLDTTFRLVLGMEKAGADIVELGVPFSDPLADGPTIQLAAMKALDRHVNIKKTLDTVKKIRRESEIPVILMLYYNLVFKYGEERFVRDCVRAGVDGLIIPDLPPDEAGGLMKFSRAMGLDTVFLLAPTSSPDRIELVEKHAKGFIYYVSLTGVTGARTKLDMSISKHVKAIRRESGMPVGVGFGISKPEHAAAVSKWADGVIVGSAIVKTIDSARDTDEAVNKVTRMVRGLKKAMR